MNILSKFITAVAAAFIFSAPCLGEQILRIEPNAGFGVDAPGITRASDATGVDPYGIIITASSNEATFNDFKLQSLPASGYAQLYEWSYDVDEWSSRVGFNTASPVLVADPYGTTNGYPFIPDTSSLHYGFDVFSGLSDNTVYCYSVFIRPGTPISGQTKVWVRLYLVGKDDDKYGYYFNVTDKGVGSPTSGGTTYKGVDPIVYTDSNGNEWVRIWLAENIDSGAFIPKIYTLIAETDGDSTFVGDNATVSFWHYGSMLNEGSYPLPFALSNGSTTAVAGQDVSVDISSATALQTAADGTLTGVLKWVPMFDQADTSGDIDIYRLSDAQQTVYYDATNGDLEFTDGTNTSTVSLSVDSGTEYWVYAMATDATDGGAGDLTVGYSSDSGASWTLDASDNNFDGDLENGNDLHLGYSSEDLALFGPLVFFDENLSEDEATTELTRNKYSYQ